MASVANTVEQAYGDLRHRPMGVVGTRDVTMNVKRLVVSLIFPVIFAGPGARDSPVGFRST